jgi:hypothetical protein
MAISLDSIYAPINDFFLKKYQGGDGSPILFRFDQYGFKIADEDYDPALHNAGEVFSDLVNRLPVLSDDDTSVVFLDKPIDEYYHQLLLKPALPCPPPGTDEATRDALQTTFASLKNAAIQDYEATYSQARSNGVADLFRLSSPTPSNWYDRTNAEIWETYSTTITDDPSSPATPAPAIKKPLWTLRLNDKQLTQLLPTLTTPATTPTSTPNFYGTETSASPTNTPTFYSTARRLSVGRLAMLRGPLATAAPVEPAIVEPTPVAPAPAAASAAPVGRPLLLKKLALRPRFAFEPAVLARPLLLPKVAEVAAPATPPEKTVVQQNFHAAFKRLGLLDKITLTNFIKDVAPTQPVSTNAVHLSFDYCLVRIDREWFSSIFLESRGWYLPGYKKGELSGEAGGLAVLPTAMLIVKNLRISANWSGDDLRSIQAATGFGPFNVDASADTSTDIGHEGIQIVGWLLQKLPPLPANDPPQ